ncbi:MAG: hypothetical protein RSA10_03060 [Bacilli bacterium]
METIINKIKIFTKEISYVKNERYKENLEKLINLLPDYFFEVPASSTGKYHPYFALNDGGLVRHTKVAVRIAKEILDNDSISSGFSNNEKDLIIMALIMHDGLKSGLEKSEYTNFDHPLLVCNYIMDNRGELSLTDKELNLLTNMIKSHMGQWNTNTYSKVVLPKPENRFQRVVHMCDFLASRKFLDVKFNDNDIAD